MAQILKQTVVAEWLKCLSLTSAGGPRSKTKLVCKTFQKLCSPISKSVSQLSSELVKVVRSRNGVPPQLHCFWSKLVL